MAVSQTGGERDGLGTRRNRRPRGLARLAKARDVELLPLITALQQQGIASATGLASIVSACRPCGTAGAKPARRPAGAASARHRQEWRRPPPAGWRAAEAGRYPTSRRIRSWLIAAGATGSDSPSRETCRPLRR